MPVSQSLPAPAAFFVVGLIGALLMPTPAAHTVGLVLANGLQEHEAEGNLDRHHSEGSVGCPCFKGAQALLDMQKAPGVEALTYQGGWSKDPPAAPLGGAAREHACGVKTCSARVARKTRHFSQQRHDAACATGPGGFPAHGRGLAAWPVFGGPSRPSSRL